MDAVRAWLDRAARRADRAPGLEEALWGGRFARYAGHRLRFFAARTAVASVLHAARIAIAFRAFSDADFRWIAAAEAAALFAAAYWWGSLEPMREAVRDAFASGKPRSAEARVSRGLALALRLGAFAAAVGAALIVGRALSGRRLGPADLLLFAVSARLAVDLSVRCYHSGVYAVRRVYRPFWSLAGLEVLGFAAALTLWPIAGAWALPVASLTSLAVSAGLTVRFARKAYRHLGIAPRLAFGAGPRPRRTGPDAVEAWKAGASFALMRMDSVLPLALLSAGRRGLPAAAAFLLAASPLIRAGFDWSQLFYFDLKKLDVPLLGRLKDAFERRLGSVAAAVGLACWAGSLGLGVFFFGRWTPTLIGGSLAFFLVRAWAASWEMKAFAARAYFRLAVAGVLTLAGAAGAARLMPDATAAVAAALAGFAAAGAWLALSLGPANRSERRPKTPLSFADWVEALRGAPGPIAVGAASFAGGSTHRGLEDPGRWRREDRWAHLRIADSAARRLGPRGRIALAGPARLIWFAAPLESGLSDRWLLAEGMGLLKRLEKSPVFPSGREAAARLARTMGASGSAPDDSGKDIVGAFRSRFPDGLVLGPGIRPPDAWRGLAGETKKEIWRDALAFAAGSPTPRPVRYDVTADWGSRGLGVVFAAPADADEAARRDWRRRIRRRNRDAAFRESGTGPG